MRKITLLLGLFFICSSNYSISQTPITDANFNAAIQTCLSTNPVDGLCSESEYGAMPDWDVSNVTDMSDAFVDKTNFNADLSGWDVSSVIDMHWMFVNSGFNQPIGNWDVSNVTTMSGMFYGTDFNQPIGNWDMSSMTNMSGMFEKSSFNQPIGSWDVSNVTNMRVMFKESNFNQPIGTWDVSSVTDMTGMFQDATSFSTANYDNLLIGWASLPTLQANVSFSGGLSNYCNGASDRNILISTYGWTITDAGLDCASLTPLTDANIHEAVDLWVSDQATAIATYGYISDWNTSNITNMFGLFVGLDIDWNIGNWDVSSVTNMSWMFEDTNFNEISGIGDWDVSSVTNMSVMFENSNFNEPIGNWNVSSVTDMSSMFYGASEFNQPIGDWDVSNVTDMSFMFKIFGNNGYSYFNQPIGNWNVSSVTNMSSMFYDASAFNQPIGDWDVSSVTDMSGMFGSYYDSSSFNQPIGDWDVSSVTDMSGMFGDYYDSSSFNQPIGNWDVSSVTNMSSMFYSCTFNQDIGNWDVSNVTDMSYMFYSDMINSFNKHIGNWDVSNVTDMSYMFAVSQHEQSFFNQPIGDWDVSSVTTMEGMFQNTTFNQPIGNWDVSSVTNMSGMFGGYDHSPFNQPIGNWDVSSVTNMSFMFNSSAFNQDIGSWNVSNVTDMTFMFRPGNMSIENYDALLNGWASLSTLQPGVSFDIRISNYCNGETARDYIINTYGWTINDAGKDCTNIAVNCLTVEDTIAFIGDTNAINVILESTQIIKGFQFDITFPDGFVFDINDITNTGLPENFQVTCSNVGGNSYRVIGFSLSNETIAAGMTSILTFPIFINEEALDGEYPIPVTGLILSDVNNVDIASLCSTDGIVTVYRYSMGDTNGDDTVNVLDILGTVDYIFGNPPSTFYFELADVNFDDSINILDVLIIQDIILSPTAGPFNNDSYNRNANNLVGDNYLIVTNNAFTPNTTETIEINLENDDIIKGFQFDFILPEGFTIDLEGISGSSRLDGFTISAQEVSTNTYRVIAFSLTSDLVESGTGIILDIPVFVEPDISNAIYPIAFTDVIISDVNNLDVSTVAPSIGEITISTLGITNSENYEYSLKLYPNPVQKILSIDTEHEATYSMYDLNGRFIRKGTVLLGKNKIDVSFLQSGLYYLKFNNDRNELIKKFIKK